MATFHPIDPNEIAILLMAHCPSGILVSDQQGTICLVNAALEQLTGYTEADLIGRSVALLVPSSTPEHEKHINAYFQAPSMGAMHNRPELQLKTNTGVLIPVDITLIQHRNSTDQYAIALVQDLRQNNQKALLAAQRFHDIFQHLPLPLALHDSHGNITALNEEFKRTFGYDRNDIPNLEQWWQKAYPNAEYRTWVQNEWREKQLKALQKNQTHEALQLTITCKDGKKRIADVSASTLHGAFDGEHLVVLRDVTEMQRAAILLAQSEARFREMIEGHQLPMLLVEPKSGNITFANQSACCFYQYSNSELTQLRIHQLYREPDSHIDKLIASIRRSELNTFNRTQYNRSGEALTVEVFTSLISIQDSEFIFSIVIDKTEIDKLSAGLSNSKNRYKKLFDRSATAITLQDQTALFTILEKLRAEGVSDLAEHLQRHPDLYQQLRHSILVNSVNPAFESLLTLAPGAMQGNSLPAFQMDGAQKVFMAQLLAMWKGETVFESTIDLLDANFRTVTSLINLPIPSTIEEAQNVPVSYWDIRPLERAKQELSFHSHVLSALKEGVHLVERNSGKIVFANDRFNELFGYSGTELLGQQETVVKSGTEAEIKQLLSDISYHLETRGAWFGEVKNRKKDNTTFWCDVSISLIEHPIYGSVWVAVHSDITEQRSYNQRLWRQANYDNLTRLPNRKYFFDRGNDIIVRAKRQPVQFALMFIDLDDFKIINDTLGHRYGDGLLVEVGSRLEQCIRETDLIGRFGGDEFVIAMIGIDINKPGTIELLADKVLKSLSAPFFIKGNPEHISASIGISTYPADATDMDTLVQYADQAMYQSKRAGKNRFSFFTSKMQDLALRNRELTRALREAIPRKEIEVYYQPIVHCESGEIHKAEALARWNHAEFGTVSPAEFIPLAEESGLICELGNQVFDECLKTLSHLQNEVGRAFQISLNKSPVQLHTKTENTELAWPKEIKSYGLPASSICIEITERLLIEESCEVADKIKKLEQSGFLFSIDDFGTGYSALSYLQRYKFHFLKIDKSFIDSLDLLPGNQALCEAIIAMAHKLEMEVIAEGIETRSQYLLLKGMDCDYCQGYYFSKPLPKVEFLAFLDLSNKRSQKK